MSAKLPRSQAGKTQPKLAASSKEAGSKKKSTMSGGSFQHQLSGKSARELAKGDHVSERLPWLAGWRCHCLLALSHCLPPTCFPPPKARPSHPHCACPKSALVCQPWSGVAEALLSPLPPDWRNNIEQAFSNIGEALGKMLGGGGKEGGHRQVSCDGAADRMRVDVRAALLRCCCGSPHLGVLLLALPWLTHVGNAPACTNLDPLHLPLPMARWAGAAEAASDAEL